MRSSSLDIRGFNTIKSSIVFFRIHILFAIDMMLWVWDGGGGGDGGGDDSDNIDESEMGDDGGSGGEGEGALIIFSCNSFRVSSPTISVISFHFKYSIHDLIYS